MSDLDPAVKTEQFDHQRELYLKHRDDRRFALFWEMGLGKTKVLLDIASHLFLTPIDLTTSGLTPAEIDAMANDRPPRRIDCLIVVAPKSVYKNWLGQEIPQHLAAPYVGMAYHTGNAGSYREQTRQLLFMDSTEWVGHLRVLCVSYNSICTARGYEFVRNVATLFRCMIVADESTAIKRHGTQVAKTMKQIGQLCPYRWIATGTPAAQSPFDVHSQIQFLDQDFWRDRGFRSYEAFKTSFGVFKRQNVGRGRVINQLSRYRDVETLHRLLQSVSSRLLKEDSSVKLPPKLYSLRTFELHPKQRAAYEALTRSLTAELDEGDGFIEAALAIVRMARLLQITSGFVMAERYVEASVEANIVAQSSETDADTGELTAEAAVAREIMMDSIKSKMLKPSSDDVSYGAALAIAKSQLDLYESDDPESPDVVDVALIPDVPIRMSERVVIDIIPPSENPRLQLLLELLREALPTGKVIVWCRFRRDVEMICNALGEGKDATDLNDTNYSPGRCVRYDGSTSAKMRQEALDRFRDPDDVARVFVANVAAISQGVTLTVAKTMIYYSNSFSLERRLQSEDRFHRIGQDRPVTIIDLAAEDTMDMRVIELLRKKYDVAAKVTGDGLREWISPEGQR